MSKSTSEWMNDLTISFEELVDRLATETKLNLKVMTLPEMLVALKNYEKPTAPSI